MFDGTPVKLSISKRGERMSLFQNLKKNFCNSEVLKETAVLSNTISQLSGTNSELERNNAGLKESLKNAQNQIDTLRTQVPAEREMTSWLDKNYGARQTLIYQKRYVLGHPSTVIPYDVREFIYPSTVLKNMNLRTIFSVWSQFIQYTADAKNEGYNEFWQMPEETAALGIGDCEDSSILRVSLCRCIGIYNTAVALGFYKGAGHAFPVMLKNGKLYILEATSNNYYELPVEQTKDYEIHWIFNEDGAWRIKSDAMNFGALAQEELDNNDNWFNAIKVIEENGRL